jgi:predicted ATPase
MKPKMRIAFAGASGTGKTTLMRYLAEELRLPTNPVGSRSVAQAMGFARPYDVDAAGQRVEFQRRLLVQKRAWEETHEEFVTDRTTFDELVYLSLHGVHGLDEELFESYRQGMERYTHVFYCPVEAFQYTGSDPQRVHEKAYHRVYCAMLDGLLSQHYGKHRTLWDGDTLCRLASVHQGL